MVNRIERDRLTHHDDTGRTFRIETAQPWPGLVFSAEDGTSGGRLVTPTSFAQVGVRRDAVETVVASLQAWLATGSLEIEVGPADSEVPPGPAI